MTWRWWFCGTLRASSFPRLSLFLVGRFRRSARWGRSASRWATPRTIWDLFWNANSGFVIESSSEKQIYFVGWANLFSGGINRPSSLFNYRFFVWSKFKNLSRKANAKWPILLELALSSYKSYSQFMLFELGGLSFGCSSFWFFR